MSHYQYIWIMIITKDVFGKQIKQIKETKTCFVVHTLIQDRKFHETKKRYMTYILIAQIYTFNQHIY